MRPLDGIFDRRCVILTVRSEGVLGVEALLWLPDWLTDWLADWLVGMMNIEGY